MNPPSRVRIVLRRIVWTLAALLLLSVLLGLHTWFFKPLHIRLFYERAFAEQVFDSPQRMSSLRLLPRWLDWYSDDLNDYSVARAERRQRRAQALLQTLRSYDRDGVSDKVSYDVLEHFLADEVAGQPFAFHEFPLNPLFGVQSELPNFMVTQHSVADTGDAKDYLSRLRQFPRVFAQVLEGEKKRETMNIVPPTFVVEKVLAQMKGFIALPPEQNLLYVSFAEKLDKAGVAAAQRDALLRDAREAIANAVLPAYQQLIAHYEALAPRTRGNQGAWSLPDGDAYYAWAVRRHTSIGRTPQELHELGLAEVTRISGEMDAILRQQGAEGPTIGERVRSIRQRSDQLYPDNDEGRAQILKDYQAIIDKVSAGLDRYFDVRPAQGVRVERVPVFKEKTSPGAYYQSPAIDGSRPGVFFANLHDIAATPRLGMHTLAYHEAIPGHHLQKGIQRGLTGLPTFRTVLGFTAFSEGWALYAERLAAEMGALPTPLDDLGRLQAEMFRAVRLVVDTGMHYKRWSREQAIDYMRDHTGLADTAVVAEIERYLVNPGQALAYKVGMNEILRLRERARNELGPRFDIRRFHNLVLTGGDMPLGVLERRVVEWIGAES